MEKVSKEIYTHILQWDIGTWKTALTYWNNVLPQNLSGYKGLELGARDGGLSLYLALKGCKVICSDIGGSSAKAIELHKNYVVNKLIKYADVNATHISFPNNFFDIVMFKSILGAIGRNNNKNNQQLAINEIYRVLKPSVLFLFAENIIGSGLHRFLRTKFVPWGRSWRYISIEEMKEFCSPFIEFNYSTAGVFACFGRTERQRQIFAKLDKVISNFVPEMWKYVIFGHACK